MARLFGQIWYDHHKGHVTRTAHRAIEVQVQTWHGKVNVNLDADGRCSIAVGPFGPGVRTIWTGNVNQPPTTEEEVSQ